MHLQKASKTVQTTGSTSVYGRNIIQHPNPAGILAAHLAVVHQRAKSAD